MEPPVSRSPGTLLPPLALLIVYRWQYRWLLLLAHCSARWLMANGESLIDKWTVAIATRHHLPKWWLRIRSPYSIGLATARRLQSNPASRSVKNLHSYPASSSELQALGRTVLLERLSWKPFIAKLISTDHRTAPFDVGNRMLVIVACIRPFRINFELFLIPKVWTGFFRASLSWFGSIEFQVLYFSLRNLSSSSLSLSLSLSRKECKFVAHFETKLVIRLEWFEWMFRVANLIQPHQSAALMIGP